MVPKRISPVANVLFQHSSMCMYSLFRPRASTPQAMTEAALLEHADREKPRMHPVRREFTSIEPLDQKALEKIPVQLGFHRTPGDWSDYVAFRVVRGLRFIADNYFRYRYIHRFIFLETVAAVPGMVGGMMRHLKCLRRMEHDSGWIQRLLHEAENERMHLMIWMEITRPNLFERVLVTLLQGAFFNCFFWFYLISPKTAHRMVGYLEEEAVRTYTHFLEELDNGNKQLENTRAPKIAIDYYNLEKEATLRDVVLAVRADEAAHRDVNHHFADRIIAGNENLGDPLNVKPVPADAGELKLTR